MTPQELKNSVLQLAIQGKLVEQRSEEGTGDELYQRIQAEKQALVKAGKVKKEKPLPEIAEEEMPFEIPESWKWVRLIELGSFSSGKTPTMGEAKYWNNGTVQWFTSKDMKEIPAGAHSNPSVRPLKFYPTTPRSLSAFCALSRYAMIRSAA